MKVTKVVPALLLLLALIALAAPTAAAPIGVLGKCLDVRGGVLEPGTPVQLFTCNGTAAQDWFFAPGNSWDSNTIRLRQKDNMCLMVSRQDAGNGVSVYLYNCGNNGDAGFWMRAQPPVYRDKELIKTRLPGNRCLDVQGGNTADGTPIQVYDCNGTLSQAFGLGSSN